MTEQLLDVNKLQIAFKSEKGETITVDDVSFSLKSGQTLGIVGESGCGKSVTSLSIIKLLGSTGYINNGDILFNQLNLKDLSEAEMRKIRGNDISMIFQEPMTSLNPVFTIGNQMIEIIMLHLNYTKKEARKYAIQMLDKVGIPRPNEIIDEYPHKLSGGMRQRVMIALALSCHPKLLIADEPTTALDVTIQAQILELMKKLRDESNTAIIIISHDLGVIAEMADKVIVMYAGQVVEEADVFQLFDNPKHPYTQGLMSSIPHLEYENTKRLYSIPGSVPTPQNMPKGCRFHDRCPQAMSVCINTQPKLLTLEDEHKVRCWLYEKDISLPSESSKKEVLL